ncbi:MAG: trigger factor [Chloroflexota bacterium]
MNVEVTKLPESRVALKIELSPVEVDQALERTYKQLVQRVNVPGFRKGKAPRAVVERMVGNELFLHEATDEAVRWGYRKAVEQEKLTPIDEAQISTGDEHSHLQADHSFEFEATVSVEPDVQLPDYQSLHLERPVVEVSDDDVEGLVQDLRERTATLEPASGPADYGYVVTMNINGKVEGQEIVNEENGEYELRDEEKGEPDPVFPDLSKQLVGANPGDIREITLQLPELYKDQEFAGKAMFLRVLVKELKRKVLPDLNDEFAQSISELQTLDEMREALRRNLELERRVEADREYANQVVEAVTGRTFVEIPPVLIEEEIDRELNELQRMFDSNKLSFAQYLQTSGKAELDVRNDMREDATQSVKRSLVMDAVAEKEGIEISNRQIESALDEVLRSTNVSETERRRYRSSSAVRQNIRDRLQRQQAIQKLVDIMSNGEGSQAANAEQQQTVPDSRDTEETVAVEVGG